MSAFQIRGIVERVKKEGVEKVAPWTRPAAWPEARLKRLMGRISSWWELRSEIEGE